MTHQYGSAAKEFSKGDRVALHPADDRFMRGVRYGTVTRIAKHCNGVCAVMDRTGKEDIFAPWKLRKVEQ